MSFCRLSVTPQTFHLVCDLEGHSSGDFCRQFTQLWETMFRARGVIVTVRHLQHQRMCREFLLVAVACSSCRIHSGGLDRNVLRRFPRVAQPFDTSSAAISHLIISWMRRRVFQIAINPGPFPLPQRGNQSHVVGSSSEDVWSWWWVGWKEGGGGNTREA